MTVLCISCGRKHGNSAFGISVNDIGCTGACLHWAIHALSNPYVADEDAARIELICSDVNPRGCAMLTYTHYGADSVYMVDCVECLPI